MTDMPEEIYAWMGMGDNGSWDNKPCVCDTHPSVKYVRADTLDISLSKASLMAALTRLYYEAIEPIATLGLYHAIHNPHGNADGGKAVEIANKAHTWLEKIIDKIEAVKK